MKRLALLIITFFLSIEIIGTEGMQEKTMTAELKRRQTAFYCYASNNDFRSRNLNKLRQIQAELKQAQTVVERIIHENDRLRAEAGNKLYLADVAELLKEIGLLAEQLHELSGSPEKPKPEKPAKVTLEEKLRRSAPWGWGVGGGVEGISNRIERVEATYDKKKLDAWIRWLKLTDNGRLPSPTISYKEEVLEGTNPYGGVSKEVQLKYSILRTYEECESIFKNLKTWYSPDLVEKDRVSLRKLGNRIKPTMLHYKKVIDTFESNKKHK